jgi:RHS repeat-associated protein
VKVEPERVRTVSFLWDGNALAQEIDSERGKRVYVHNPRSLVPLLQEERGRVFTYVVDHLGTSKELIDEEGRVAWSAAHTAWGSVLETSREQGAAPVESPFRLLGQYHDEETGLACTRFRYFDAGRARWLSPDPLGIAGGKNLLGFNGAPSTDTDPLGLHKNEHLAGDEHPKTGVPFNASGYPEFDSLFDVTLPKSMIGPTITDDAQMKFATKELAAAIEEDPGLKARFTKAQLEDIGNGEARIAGLTWHHNEDGETMQLVDRETHAKTGHAGGRCNTGGRPR